jgi:signal transduction histidine kinase
MSVTASWARKYWLELLWVLFSGANLFVLVRLVDFETVPFHFIWISFALVYAYRTWEMRSTLLTLAGICVATGVGLGWVVTQGPQGPDELMEVPLMAGVFLAMVWHAQRRQAAVEELKLAAEREHEFVRDASHQLKTPITVARGFAQLIRDSPAPAKADIEVLVEELDRLARVADGLLVLAATRQYDSLARVAIELDDVVASSARRWRATASRRWEFECNAAGLLYADRLRLDSAVYALIENAVEATDENDRIAVVASAEGEVALIEISDSGIGIPEAFVPRIFDRFWTTGDPANVEAGGTGLGLSIVKAIAEAHGGSVSVRSAVGVGTTFSLRIPNFIVDDELAYPRGRRRLDARTHEHSRQLERQAAG